jgi:hypothetical protein
MPIDRSNYEIWLIDYLDGKLSDLQVEHLKLFLTDNPDLREEFDELNTFSLNPLTQSYPHKDYLKKSTADLAGSQFEYLCVAFLENDLPADQQNELKESLDRYPEKKRTFELIQKMRLNPAGISYRYKNQLMKRTAKQNIIKLSVIGLSAAAVISLIIITYLILPRTLPNEINNTVQNFVNDSSHLQSAVKIVSERIITDKKPDLTKQNREYINAGVQNYDSVISQPDLIAASANDSSLGNRHIPEIQLNKIPVYAEIKLNSEIIRNTVVASNFDFIIPPYYDERSKLSKFIAKTFREKILKENTSEDGPLKAYEIAEAGVTGLNRLLGWEMALEMKNDENGELRSVYFSSKILKFNAPVKKQNP